MHLLSRTMRRPFATLSCLTAVLLTACADQLTAPAARPTVPLGLSDVLVMQPFSGNMRIGVVPAASSITVGSTSDWTITNKATGAVLMTGAAGDATVRLASVLISVTRFRLQVVCGSAAAVAAWEARAQAAGHPTLTEVIPTCTRLYIGDFPSNAAFGVRNTYRNLLISQGLAGTDSFWKLVTVSTGTTEYEATRGADRALSPAPMVLTAANGIVRINNISYRGAAEVTRNGSGTLAGVNVVPLEQYLYGVVPRELPPGPWPQPEAQKAQAVAARTYALSGVGKRASEGYDLLATTSDQVYGGYSAEHPVSTAAVDATAGIVATFKDAAGNDRLIQALFSSTTGGWTANNEEVFNSAPVSYLRSVPDAQRGEALEHVPTLDVFRNHANPRSLRAERHGAAEADWSKYHRWSFEWTAEEISEVLSLTFGTPEVPSVGTVREINVLERGPSGRVTLIEFVTDAGTFTRTKDAIRGTLKYIDAAGTPQSLLSTLFFIEPVLDKKTHELSGFQVFGGGWGHGVGLGQTGAAGMAQKGATYDEILKHYYQGIELIDYRDAD